MSDWRPIETAPRDGSVFLGHDPDDRWPQPMRWFAYDAASREEIGEAGYWNYAEELLAEVTDGATNPTHWQPLPSPPETENG